MKKEFVSYFIALRLKELGFDKSCLAFWDCKNPDEIHFNILRDGSGDYKPFLKNDRLQWFGAPLYSQAVSYLLKKYQLFIEIELTDTTTSYYFTYNIVNSKDRDYCDEDFTDSAKRTCDYKLRYKSYEEAREQAILKCIELCQKEK